MNIGIKFPPRTDRKNKKETLFWAALEFIEHKKGNQKQLLENVIRLSYKNPNITSMKAFNRQLEFYNILSNCQAFPRKKLGGPAFESCHGLLGDITY